MEFLLSNPQYVLNVEAKYIIMKAKDDEDEPISKKSLYATLPSVSVPL